MQSPKLAAVCGLIPGMLLEYIPLSVLKSWLQTIRYSEPSGSVYDVPSEAGQVGRGCTLDELLDELLEEENDGDDSGGGVTVLELS